MRPSPVSAALSRAALGWAVLVYLVLTGAYLVSTPAYEAPDEGDHYRYAIHLAQTGELPLIPGTAAALGRPRTDEETQGYHPPLYYGLLAASLVAFGHEDTLPSRIPNPEFGDWTDPQPSMNLVYLHGADERAPRSPEIKLLWLLRGWSTLFGLFGVLLTFALGRLAFPGRPAIAATAAVLIAVTPKWTYMHGALNNGLLATLLCHVVVLVAATGLARRRLGPGAGALCGLGMGLALLAKLTALFLWPTMAVVYVWAWLRWRERRSETLRSALVALAVLSLVTGWWFVRNTQLYGSPLALDVHRASFESIKVPEGRLGEWLTEWFLPDVFGSLLGHFGWWILAPLWWMVRLGQALVWFTLAGWLLHRLRLWRRGHGARIAALERESYREDVLADAANLTPVPEAGASDDAEPASDRAVIVLLIGVTLIVFAVTLNYNLIMRGSFARYLFPALGSMAVLMASGLVLFVEGWAPRVGRLVLAAGAVALPIVCGWVLVNQFRPAFSIDLAPAPRYFASMVEDIIREPETPRLQLLEPADGARLSAAPVLAWTPADDVPAGEAVYTVHMSTASGRVLVASHEMGHIELAETRWQLPPEAWVYVPVGEVVRWKVRRVPDRAAGETVQDVPGSAAFELTRTE